MCTCLYRCLVPEQEIHIEFLRIRLQRIRQIVIRLSRRIGHHHMACVIGAGGALRLQSAPRIRCVKKRNAVGIRIGCAERDRIPIDPLHIVLVGHFRKHIAFRNAVGIRFALLDLQSIVLVAAFILLENRGGLRIGNPVMIDVMRIRAASGRGRCFCDGGRQSVPVDRDGHTALPIAGT